MAVSKSDIREAVNELSEWTGLPLRVQWAYGRPRIFLDDPIAYTELSPRLPTGQLMDWIIAFSKGFEYGLKK